MVLGIPDFWVYSAYLLCLLSAAGCVVYGILNWNKGADSEADQLREEASWETEEHKIEEKI